ncbi:MAG: hypothetical protein KDE27_03595 [Planctomycetes bacterium]|nr:hypothetical protein [Planctomycetota bacterium]
MKYLTSLLFSLLFVTATTAMAPAPSVAPTAAVAGLPTACSLPIKIRGAGVVTGDPTLPGGAPFVARGTANHLGHWTNSGVLAIDPVTLAATGDATFRAANGDELDATFDGSFDPLTGTATATFHWNGGTGRFANASGDADFVVVQDPSGSFSFVAAGTLNL